MIRKPSRSGKSVSDLNELGLWLEFYRQMYTIRRVEETLLSLFGQGAIAGTIHTAIGQEACAVGVINALDRTKDVVTSTHRGHGHLIALYDQVEGLIAEVMGKETGMGRGVGGSQHIHFRNFYSNGILGGMLPIAVGMALAEKFAGSGAIVVAFMGDGTFGEGVTYESLNIAAKWQAPVLFVCEHNGYAQSTPTHVQHAGELARRAEPFGIPCVEVQADDVRKVFQVTQGLVNEVRNHQTPHLLLLHTYRLAPHSKGDDNRAAEEIEAYRKRDPLVAFRSELMKLDSKALASLEGEIEKRVAEAVEAAKRAEDAKSWLRELPR